MEKPSWWPILEDKQFAFALFSGGKDSEAALCYVKELFDLYDHASELITLYVNTTVDLPGVQEFVEEFCQTLNVKLVILRPEKDYFTLAERWGVPRPRARWCCFTLKIKPIKDYLHQFSNQDYVVLDGIRREESRKRSGYPATYNHRHFGFVIHPIIDWTGRQVDSYLKERGLPINPAYKMGFNSCECWCGVNKRKSEFERLRDVAPQFFMKLVDLESKFESGYAYAYCNNKPLYLRDLLKERSDQLESPSELEEY